MWIDQKMLYKGGLTGICNIGLHLITRGSAIAEEPRDARRQLKYYGRFFD